MKICNGIDGHHGPIVPTGSVEPIDHGIAIWFRCETCGREGDTSIDLDEIEIDFEAPASRYLDLLVEYGYDGSSEGPFGESGVAPNFYEAPDEGMKFALIELNRNGAQVWITRWPSIGDALLENANQEYAQDWTNAHIVDLANGAIYDIVGRPHAVRRET